MNQLLQSLIWRKLRTLLVCLLLCIVVFHESAHAVNRVSSGSGNFSTPTTWIPAGIPTNNDQLTIVANHNILLDNNSNAASVTVNAGGQLIWSTGKKLTVANGFVVNGKVEIIDGDIELTQSGSPFQIGPAGSLNWSPLNNTVAGATLFTNGVENFSSTSTLIISKWYNYNNVPLASVVTGNFGNLSLTTLTNGLLFEWNQNNQFEQHKILGTLTIDQGWIVLDKSGSISNTFINAIYLKNVNSYLDIHSGTHPGTFTVKTNSLINIGGVLNGIYNGDGNINLEVDGDITNLGNIELIYNSGVQGISNGNASLKVTGLFKQTTGDFRGIFNLSSTNIGTVDLEFENMEVTGGIFMAQYGCHTNNQMSHVTVNKNLTIDFINSSSKFRGNGLTALGGIANNLQQQFIIKGNLLIKGNTSAEFTSSGSTGIEEFSVLGNSGFEGCNSNFNYGMHTSNLQFIGDVTVKGGIVNLSKTEGSSTVNLTNNLDVQYGQLNLKSEPGNSSVTINGNYSQSGGIVYLYNNSTTATSKIVYLTVNGEFSNVSGSINFDNNSASSAKHILSLNGSKFTIGGQATITGSVSQQNPGFGTIYFDHAGPLQYYENSASAKIQNIKQVVSSGCVVQLAYGNMQAASTQTPAKDMIRIAGGGIIDAGSHQIYSNGVSLYSGIKVDDNGRIRCANTEGLYNGAAGATIKANSNMTFTLQPLSIIEYYGNSNQYVTGTGIGTAQTTDQQYGILEINKETSSAKLNSSTVLVRSNLDLTKGELYLNGYNITINSGSTNGITTVSGYIKSETLASNTNGLVIWKNIEPGMHTIPFGVGSEKQIPFKFTPITGTGGEMSISTRGCTKDNRPLNPGITNLNLNNTDVSVDRTIDRWYFIHAPGITADIIASYLPDENSTLSSLSDGNFSFINWNGSKWTLIGGTGNGTTQQVGTVALANNSKWGNLLIVSNEKLEKADILSFDAKLNVNKVDLKWVSIANVNPQSYTVERSTDGYNFTSIIEKQAYPSSNNNLEYNDMDLHPIKGISFYRLRQNNANDQKKYSENVQIEIGSSKQNTFELITAVPNPFSSTFDVAFNAANDGVIEIKLVSTNGQIVYKQSLIAVEGKNSFTISNQEKMLSGIYILTISDGRSVKNYKMFKI